MVSWYFGCRMKKNHTSVFIFLILSGLLGLSSCRSHLEMPYVCTAVTDETIHNPWYQGLILSAAIPRGATMTTPLNPAGETVIRYQGERYTFTARREGATVCLDFHPPIPLPEGSASARFSQIWHRALDLLPKARLPEPRSPGKDGQP